MPNDNNFNSSSKDFSVDLRTYNSPVEMSQEHYHHCYEILYLTHNSRILKIGDNRYNLNKYSVALLPPFIPHMTLSDGDVPQRRICIYFRSEFIREIELALNTNLLACFNPEYPVRAVDDFFDSFWHNMCEIEKNRTSSVPSEKLMLRNRLLLCDTLLLLNNKTILSNNENVFQKIITYIEKNFNKRITLELLSKEFFIDPFTISRKFNSIIGMPLPKYISTIRIIHAKKMLLESKASLTDIAMACGFSSLSDFDRVFKTDTGMTPFKYRKNASEKNSFKN